MSENTSRILRRLALGRLAVMIGLLLLVSAALNRLLGMTEVVTSSVTGALAVVMFVYMTHRRRTEPED